MRMEPPSSFALDASISASTRSDRLAGDGDLAARIVAASARVDEAREFDAPAFARVDLDLAGDDRGRRVRRAPPLADAPAEGVRGRQSDVAPTGVDRALLIDRVGMVLDPTDGAGPRLRQAHDDGIFEAPELDLIARGHEQRAVVDPDMPLVDHAPPDQGGIRRFDQPVVPDDAVAEVRGEVDRVDQALDDRVDAERVDGLSAEHEELAGGGVDLAEVEHVSAVEERALARFDRALDHDGPAERQERLVHVPDPREVRADRNQLADVDDGVRPDEYAVGTGKDEGVLGVRIDRADLAVQMGREVAADDVDVGRVDLGEVEVEDVVFGLVQAVVPDRFAQVIEGGDRRLAIEGVVDVAVAGRGRVRLRKFTAGVCAARGDEDDRRGEHPREPAPKAYARDRRRPTRREPVAVVHLSREC